MRILIADDHQQITSILKDYAEKEGFLVSIAADGEEALELFERESFDMILLDVMMPKKDGFEVCREIRKTSNVPVIMVTARGEDFERIMGLDIGADDYIIKPFSPGEVMARVRAILRRIETIEDSTDNKNILIIDDLKIDMNDFEVTFQGEVLSLTKKETEILWTLARNKNKLFTRDHLLDLLWGYDYDGDSRTVDSHIKRLRQKLDQHAHPHWEIKTVWGMGYKFEVIDET
ncbi:MAG: response regulator transcription factor [Clostridium sp.]|nr:response regulator transcription factor [Clostridium sp.]